MFTEEPYYFNGICYSLRAPKCIAERGIAELVVLTNRDVEVFVHYKSQFRSPNARQGFINVV